MKEREQDRASPQGTEEKGPKHKRPAAKERSTSLQHSVLDLQRTVGNQSIGSLLNAGATQSKLRVSQPDDADEREAGRVADQVVSAEPSTLQRKCACEGGASCPACEREKVEQRTHRDESQPSNESETNNFQQSPVQGQPLDAATRTFMESRFDADLGAVQIHTDNGAAESARSLNADAYTHLNHIYFANGKYDPATPSGRRLLAHELTHTVQQKGTTSAQTPKLVTTARASAFDRIQRQAAGAPDPNKMNDCRDLLGRIKATVAELLQRAADLISDPQNLQWDNWNVPKILPDGTNLGSVVGHQQQYEGWRNRLRNLIEEWDDDDCNSTGLRVPKDVRDLQFKPAPAPTPKPRPDTGPKPSTPPGAAPSESQTAKRLAAAAKGAAIGATAGLIVGGIVGAIGGGAGGTVVAPGVGTVGLGVAGAVAGAEAGAPIGAALGASIGSLIGWLSS